MKINLIVAIGKNQIIGNGAKLPWNIPSDLKYFKEKTLQTTIIMGRKTFESIGRALPKRNNIIITSTPDKYLDTEGIIAVNSVAKAIQESKNYETDIFIIGGSYIYQAFLDLELVDKMYITHVLNYDIEGDIYFPKVDFSEWEEVNKSEILSENGYEFYFAEYQKIK